MHALPSFSIARIMLYSVHCITNIITDVIGRLRPYVLCIRHTIDVWHNVSHFIGPVVKSICIKWGRLGFDPQLGHVKEWKKWHLNIPCLALSIKGIKQLVDLEMYNWWGIHVYMWHATSVSCGTCHSDYLIKLSNICIDVVQW